MQPLPETPAVDREILIPLRRFIRALIALASLFGLVELVGLRWVPGPLLLLSSLSMWIVVAVALVALAQLRRGRVQVTAMVVGYTLLTVALMDAPLLHFAIPCILLVPIIAVASVLPYLSRGGLAVFVSVAFLAECAVAAVGAFLPAKVVFPRVLHIFLYAGSSAAAAFLVLLLLVQFRSRLGGALEDTRTALQLRDDFLSLAAHELRTPLTPLRLYLNSLRRTPPDASEISEGALELQLNRMDRQVARLTRLVSDLLDVSRIHSGRLALKAEPLDFVQIARDVTTSLSEEAHRAGSQLSIEAGVDSLPGVSDPHRIEQILLNLLTNALKYGNGSPVRVSVQDSAETVRFEVADGGIGISEVDQQRLFQRFERAVPSRSYQGLGLGLWITRQIAEGLGGSVGVTSAPEAGATFVVVLPRDSSAVLHGGAAGL